MNRKTTEKTLEQAPLSLDPLEVYKLRLQHRLTFRQIGQLLHAPVSTVHYTFQAFLKNLGTAADVESYENAKQQLLSHTEERLMATLLDEDKLEKASLNNVAYAFTQIHTALRLEKGKSTSNINALAAVIVKAQELAYPRVDQSAKSISNRQRPTAPDGHRDPFASSHKKRRGS